MPAAPPVYMPPMPMDDDEPASKKSRMEEHLVPEGEFLARNQGPVTFKVSVPNMADKPEWKCDGQMMSVTLALTETVNSVKSKIMEEIGMPQGKQKLQHEALFLKVFTKHFCLILFWVYPKSAKYFDFPCFTTSKIRNARHVTFTFQPTLPVTGPDIIRVMSELY